MTNMLLAHVQATPARTLLALTAALVGKVAAERRLRAARWQADAINDRTLRDIGLSRCMLLLGTRPVELA